MNVLRRLATPLAFASFAFVGTTGVFMFLRFGNQLVQEAHERLGLILVVAVVAHALRNWRGLRSYVSSTSARVAVAVVALLGALFIGERAFAPTETAGDKLLRAFTRSSVDDVAKLVGTAPELLRERLRRGGVVSDGGRTSFGELAKKHGKPAEEVVRLALTP